MDDLSWWKKACAVFVVSAATAVAGQAQTFTKLVDFEGRNGANPYFASLVQGVDGSFYGTTADGGAKNVDCGGFGCGTVFRIAAGGTLASLRTIPPDGFHSEAGLVLGASGSFLGTAYGGGANNRGAVFEVTRTGALTTLYSFCSQAECLDGEFPVGGLTQGIDGNFYGTTAGGGSGSSCGDGCGTVFKITPAGTLTTLYSFCEQANCPDGEFPFGALTQGTDGSFYGTTVGGGTSNSCERGSCGTVFKITTSGTLTVLHSFDSNDGAAPRGGLVQATDGSFYGTALGGGANGYGTVFRITSGGILTVLHSFDVSDGSEPTGTLIQATDGNLYGTTTLSGAASYGTVFEITTGGTLTTLHSFNNIDGAGPGGGLLQATNGIFYGTATEGGDLSCIPSSGCGTVFSLDMGLGPFVTFVRAGGKVGQTGGILGQGFTGTTGVSLNGTLASFTVVSDTLIKATVPAGATTGYVTVTTPSGTLTSNVPFHVIK